MDGHKENLDKFYETPDPWGFKKNPDDKIRKEKILSVLKPYGLFERALDVGAGEGWITKDLPADIIEAIELSEVASSRIPDPVKVIKFPTGNYDLIVATGVLYKHYNGIEFLKMIKEFSNYIILTCNIQEWEIPETRDLGKQVYFETFPYREYAQALRVFEL